MAKNRDERHRYGQHYTPLEVAELLAAFAVRSETELVLDPSCGDGRLLSEALRRVRVARNLFGIDLSDGAVGLAAKTGARVARADFLDVEPGARVSDNITLPLMFDAIIGNPPYIRQELMGARDKWRAEKRLERDRLESPEISWPRWSRRSDMYVYFFAHSTRFLRPGGRLVFLTAGSWLDAGYGAPLRDFLRDNFKIVSIIESAAESFFADASVNTIITVLERETEQSNRDANPVRLVQLSRPLAEILSANDHKKAVEFARSIEQERSSTALDTHRIRILAQSELPRAGNGWGRYLRAEDAFFRVIERAGAKLKELSAMAQVRYGVKTGANEFFYVKDARLLPLAEVASVRRGITTGANEFFYVRAVSNSQAGETVIVEDKFGARRRIEARFLSPVVFSLKEISGIVLDKTRAAKLFFNCANAPEEIAGTHAFEYVAAGERAGYHLRPTCRARSPWYSVARGRKPAPLIFPSKVGERWVVALNRDGVFEDKKLYGIFPRKGVSTAVLAALLNSTWVRYFAELTCRQMTGAQAIADIDVIVAERLLLPDPRELSPEIKRELETALRTLARRPIFSVFEEVNHLDRRKLDDLVLSAIGFTRRREREDLLDKLYEAVTKLVRERLEKTVIRGR
ncbi:MAG TPA: N-6 DNA methylase [Blastocatellia bacterium]|nr:N-6 DNA methylase [Blastocatellia bacterium]